MAKKPESESNLFLSGHIRNLKEEHGVVLSENNEKGVRQALEQNAGTIFSALNQEIGNKQIEMALQLAEHLSEAGSEMKQAAQHHAELIAEMLQQLNRLQKISAEALENNPTQSEYRQALEQKVQYLNENLARWQQEYEDFRNSLESR